MQKLYRAKPIDDTKIKQMYMKNNPDEECWKNDRYTVFVRRNQKIPDQEFTYCHISISRNDKRALPDWRDFQWIKNQLVGDENEGIELFPAESRLVDGANQFHLWVMEDPKFRFPFGWWTRIVTEKSFVGETQRKFPEARKPDDLRINEQAIDEELKKSGK